MRLLLESTWRPELQRAEILDPALDTLLACDAHGRARRHSRSCAWRIRRRVSPCSAPVELKRFYVDKAWHGQGLARTLMEAVEAGGARARGARVVAGRLGAQRARAGVLSQVRLSQGGHAGFRRRHGSADRRRDASRVRMNVRLEHVGAVGGATSTRWRRSTRSISMRRWVRSIAIRARDSNRASSRSAGGARLEVMTRQDVTGRAANEQLGLAHVALSVGDEAAVDALAARFRADGIDAGQRAAPHRRRLLRMRGAGSGRQSRRDRGGMSRNSRDGA